MRAFVFTDESLARRAGQFVWLEIDTEKPGNSAFRKQFPIPALPTFLIVRPEDEQVLLRWTGGATLAQLERILDQGRLAYRSGGGNDSTLARADRLYGSGDFAGAAQAYQAALEKAPSDWPPYARAVESLLFALQSSDANDDCSRVAETALPKLGHTTSAASVAGSGLGCALALPADRPGREVLIARFEAAVLAFVRDRTITMAGDDRSGLYGILYDARQDAKDEAGARAIAREWASCLEDEAARARTVEQRASFDPHRLGVYLELGEPERAVPMLQASERDLPDDYNPPARLAVAYKAMKRWEDALAATDRALAKAYGPRKLRIFRTRADVFAASGDSLASRRTLEETLRYAEALPEGQRPSSMIADLKKQLAQSQ
jgi:tetratricopeptide (TPR) repeat protein